MLYTHACNTHQMQITAWNHESTCGHEWEGASFPFSIVILDTEMVRFKLSRNLAHIDVLARLGDIAIENAVEMLSNEQRHPHQMLIALCLRGLLRSLFGWGWWWAGFWVWLCPGWRVDTLQAPEDGLPPVKFWGVWEVYRVMVVRPDSEQLCRWRQEGRTALWSSKS